MNAGRQPVERDTLYNVVAEGEALVPEQAVPPECPPIAGGGAVSNGKLRLAAVSFLNARPITYGLERDDAVDLRFDIPARCAEALARGEVDLALLPFASYATSAERAAHRPRRGGGRARAGAHGAAGRRGALGADDRASPSTRPRAARRCCCAC